MTGPRFGRRSIAGTAVAAAVLAGCQAIGPGTPVCGDIGTTGSGERARLTITASDGETFALRPSHLLQVQALPEADRGVCIDRLPRGWDVGFEEPRSGEVELSFSARSLGGRFLEVQLVDACEPSPAARQASARGDRQIERWVEVHDAGRQIPVTVTPVSDRHRRAAWDTAVALIGRDLRGNLLQTSVAAVDRGPIGQRIEDALDQQRAVFVVDDAYELRGELELRLPGVRRPLVGTLGELLAELGDWAPPPRYVATWWERSAASCTVSTFDARGPEVATVEQDALRAVGALPLDGIRRELAGLGYDLGGTPP